MKSEIKNNIGKKVLVSHKLLSSDRWESEYEGVVEGETDTFIKIKKWSWIEGIWLEKECDWRRIEYID